MQSKTIISRSTTRLPVSFSVKPAKTAARQLVVKPSLTTDTITSIMGLRILRFRHKQLYIHSPARCAPRPSLHSWNLNFINVALTTIHPISSTLATCARKHSSLRVCSRNIRRFIVKLSSMNHRSPQLRTTTPAVVRQSASAAKTAARRTTRSTIRQTRRIDVTHLIAVVPPRSPKSSH